MRLAEPLALLALGLAPLVLLLQLLFERRRNRLIAAAGDSALLERLMLVSGNSSGRTLRYVQAGLLALALALVALALARPQFGMRTEVKKGRGMDVVVALDLSRSMLAQDVVPSRLERAKIELKALIDQLPGDRVGLVGFTSIALPLCPLTVDHSAVELQLDSAIPGDLPRGGTAISEAIGEAKRMLTSSKASGAAKAIVIVTDGEENEGDPEAAAKEAQQQGIEVHVVGVGSRSGEPIPLVNEQGVVDGYVKDESGQTVVSRLNEKLLKSVSEAGGGLSALPGANGGLELGPVRARLRSLKKTDLEDRVVRIYEERYAWALWPALALLFAATWARPSRASKKRGTRSGPLASVALLALAPWLSAAGPFQREDPDARDGNQALLAGKADEAAAAYDKAALRLKDDARLLYDKAMNEAARGELDKSIELYKAATEAGKTPDLRGQSAFALGNAYRKLQRYDEAVEAYKRALLESPGHAGARRNLEITQRIKAIQAAQPKPPPKDKGDKNDDKQDRPDGGTDDGGSDGGPPPDAGDSDGGQPPDAGGDSADAGSDQDQDKKDGGGDGQDGASPPEGQDAGAAQDGGSAQSPPPEQKPSKEDLGQQDAEQILDALKAQEKALKRKELLKRYKGRGVRKDW